MKPSRLNARSRRASERAVAVDAEADAVGDLDYHERQAAPVGGDLAGVDEQCAVERPPRLPSVLGGQCTAVAILEAELAEAAQLTGASESRLEIERHVAARSPASVNTAAARSAIVR